MAYHATRLGCVPLLLGLLLCPARTAMADPTLTRIADGLVLANDHIRVVVTGGGLRRIDDVRTGETLLHWGEAEPPWYVEFGTRTVNPPPSGQVSAPQARGRASVIIRSQTAPPDAVTAQCRVTVGNEPWAELAVEVQNRAAEEIEVVGFPANARCAKGPGRFFVYPYQSGVILPMDERFGRILIYGRFPFVRGYPSNLCSMQWLGVYGPAGGMMLSGTDRYGSLKRLGATDAEGHIRLVSELQAALPPGERFAPAPWRIWALPGGDYRAMAEAYRAWVGERTGDGARAVRDEVDGVQKVPLQFISLRDKLSARPHLARAMLTHGYPEHAVREHPGSPLVPYMPYGMTFALMRGFRGVYRSHVTPQIWSPFVEGSRGWRKFPHWAELEKPREAQGVLFPGMALGEFLQRTDAVGDPAFLYVNPSFWPEGSPDFDTSRMFDKDGDGVGDTFGGFEAGASGKPHYISPPMVRDHMVGQLRRLAAFDGDEAARANGIMFDSSQVFGATLWANSRLRRDPLSCLDRNPKAQYRERYDYLGRDSAVQDKLQTYLALHEATPHAVKVGEWIGEFEPLFLDINAGSVDLKREYPDSLARPADENVIPVPLFQIVYGDSELFVTRVGAASDADLGAPDPERMIPAEVARRGSAMFGAIHQVLFWGGVHWAGPAYNRLRARTWMIVRDNAARRALFGRRADYRMLDAEGEETTGVFAVRETSWRDEHDAVVAVHWDNNAGRTATVSRRLATAEVLAKGLWGSGSLVPGSLERLRLGATVTVSLGGTFALWSFAGEIERDGVPWISVEDSADTPLGLSVVWDREYLSIANESDTPRTVRARFPATGDLRPVPPLEPTLPDGSPRPGAAPLVYNDASRWSSWREGQRLCVEATLPRATPDPGDKPLAVAASLAAFEAVTTRDE